jgi:hypothetical protein
MKFLYYLRAFFISWEFGIILASFIIFVVCGKYFHIYIEGFTPNSDALKWVMLYPLALVSLIFKKGQAILVPDEKSDYFHKWPDFWIHKIHFHVGLFYAVVLGFTCLSIWLLNETITYCGTWVFITCCISLSRNAYSFYAANIEIKIILNKVNSGIDQSNESGGQ